MYQHDFSPFKSISNGTNGTASGGSMNNPMYREVCAIGTYEPQSGRSKKRNIAKFKYGIKLSKDKMFWDL